MRSDREREKPARLCVRVESLEVARAGVGEKKFLRLIGAACKTKRWRDAHRLSAFFFSSILALLSRCCEGFDFSENSTLDQTTTKRYSALAKAVLI